MPSAPVIIYDRDMRKVAYLENAFGIGYSMPFNGLWTAQFSLPANDPKNAECHPLYHVEIYDGRDRIELFRIIPNKLQRSNDGQTITYQCEHVLATLLDDVMFQFHTVGNLGVYTKDVLQYILSKQIVKRWQLGTVAFSRQFEYNWENENLLAALFSVPKPFTEEYMWTYDTTVYPWKINLVEPPQQVNAYIRYGVNMQGIERTIDPSGLCTRIYGLGYGEGVNQLTFADINGGKPYIEDQAAIAKYGVIQRIFVDRRFEYPETLLARCQALLDELKKPRVTYSVSASEVHRLTGVELYRFSSGSPVRVQDKELGEDFVARIVNVTKRDMKGQPGEVQLEIANRPQDMAGSIADLMDRQRIEAVYAQGATNLDSHDFSDNCDPQHPAILRFYLPEETKQINKVMLNYQSEPFRAYSKAIEGGGGIATSTAAGGGSTQTSSSGGGSTQTSSSGGGVSKSTAAGGRTTQTSGSSSSQTSAPAGAANLMTTAGGDIWVEGQGYPLPGTEVMRASGVHDHGILPGTLLMGYDGSPISWKYSDPHVHDFKRHSHLYSTLDHVHDMSHTHQVSIPDHTHDFSIPDHTHTVNIPNHTHTVNIPEHRHDITLPNHTHGIQYGIFQGPTPKSVEVKVDGKIVPGLGANETEVDIIPYLAKDGGGKVRRGWHTIEIRPNDLGRIVASVFTQIFVQSRGGGNY